MFEIDPSTLHRVRICHHHSMQRRRTADRMQASYKNKFLLLCLITMESDLIYFWLWQRDPEGVAVAKEARPKKKWMQSRLTQQCALSSRKTQCWSVYQIWEECIVIMDCIWICSDNIFTGWLFVISKMVICRCCILSVKCCLVVLLAWPWRHIHTRSILLFGCIKVV